MAKLNEADEIRAAEARIKKNELEARNYEAQIRVLKARKELRELRKLEQSAQELDR